MRREKTFIVRMGQDKAEGPGNFYGEFSARAGRVRNDYTSDIRDFDGKQAGFKSSSAYYGGHLGAGYVWNPTEDLSLDLYGKYLWTRVEGDSTTLSTGDSFTLKTADSHRLRAGGRVASPLNEHVIAYAGAAWEREFDGRAKGTISGYAIPPASLKGNTGIGELGLALTPSLELPLFIDLGMQGYTGKREGVTGSLKVRFEF